MKPYAFKTKPSKKSEDKSPAQKKYDLEYEMELAKKLNAELIEACFTFVYAVRNSHLNPNISVEERRKILEITDKALKQMRK